MEEQGAGGAPGATIPEVLYRARGDGSAVAPVNSRNEKQNGRYLDVGDNVLPMSESDELQKYNAFNVEDWLNVTCEDTEFFLPGKCENGHKLAKLQVCGKEWCPRCGELHSLAHNRRFVRWLPKIQTFKRMRYMVFTIPQDLRANFRTKESLTALGREVQKMLKRHGFDRGLRRWHWFGDKSHKWHPHLNVLTDGGYLNQATIEAIKLEYAGILGYAGKVSVKVNFKARPADMAGCLSYVTRATFHDWSWDSEMAIELHNFRNMVVWGREWPAAVWQLSEKETHEIAGEKINVKAIEAIIEHKCPVCGSQIKWESALPAALLDCVDKKSIGAGYYVVEERKPPPVGDTITTVCGYKAGAAGPADGNRWRNNIKYALEHRDEIDEAKYTAEQAKRVRSRHNKFSEDLAWLEVAEEKSKKNDS